MSYQTDPEECKRIQVRECVRLLAAGWTEDYLRGSGYAEGAIIEARKQAEPPDPPLPDNVVEDVTGFWRMEK